MEKNISGIDKQESVISIFCCSVSGGNICNNPQRYDPIIIISLSGDEETETDSIQKNCVSRRFKKPPAKLLRNSRAPRTKAALNTKMLKTNDDLIEFLCSCGSVVRALC